MAKPTLTSLSEEVAALRETIEALTRRLDALQLSAAAPPPVAAPVVAQAAAPSPPPKAEGVSEEVLIAISAAIAAYLGKRPIIRQIRLLGSAAWAQQGRVTIQASHRIAVPR